MKIVITFVFGILLLLVISFIGYDLVEFQSRRADIRQLLDSAIQEERDPPANVVGLLHAAYPDGRLASFAAHILLDRLHVPTGRMLYWHVISTLWWVLVSLHLSEQERVAVVIAGAFVGHGQYGLSAAAQHWFARPLSALSASEAATLVALLQSPSLYGKDLDRLRKRRDFLLSHINNK